MTDDRVCEICSSRTAKMVVIRRRLDGFDRTFVCSECAGERARLYAGTNIDFEHVLVQVDENARGPKSAYVCQGCGASIADIIANGRPGCCACYLHFADEIESAISKAQGQLRHVGKTPGL